MNGQEVVTAETFEGKTIRDLLCEAGPTAVQNLDGLSPHDILRKSMERVRDYWLAGCAESEHEDESIVQCAKAAAVLLYAIKKHQDAYGYEKQDKDAPETIRVVAEVRYAENAEVNGEQESEDSPKMPFLAKEEHCQDEWMWNLDIEVETGKIMNWPEGVTAKTWYKVCDCCRILAKGKKPYYDYVPKFLEIWSAGYGDYINIEVGADGCVIGWDSAKCKAFIEQLENQD